MQVNSATSVQVATTVKMRPEMLSQPGGAEFGAYLDEIMAAMHRPREVLTPEQQEAAFQEIAAKYDPRAISFWEQEQMTKDLRAAGLLPDDPAVFNPHPATCLLTRRVAPTLAEAKRIQDLWKSEPRLLEKRNLIVNLQQVQYGPQEEHKFEFLSLMNSIVDYRRQDPVLSQIPFKAINKPHSPEHLAPRSLELAKLYGSDAVPIQEQAQDPYQVNFTELALRSVGISESEEAEEKEEPEQEQVEEDVADKAISSAEARIADDVLAASAPETLRLPDGRLAY